MNCAITAETKIGDLLNAYPELEGALAEWWPAFAKLRNPVLRKTVAQVATVAQAARIGNMSAAEMVRKLREATGQSVPDAAGDAAGSEALAAAELASRRIADDIDAGEMLERGVHPIGRVREGLAKLQPGEAIRLKSPFRPEPLIQAMRASGFEAYSVAASAGEHITYFGRRGTAA